jgi:hypothetical protein
MSSWEARFPKTFFVRKYTFPTKEDGSPDIAPILKALDLKEEHVQQLHTFYREHPMSVATFAVLSQAGVLEALSHLASEGTLPVRCCRGTMDEMNYAQAALAEAKTLVIDPFALATLFFSGQYEHLQKLPGKCVLCESALDEYAELQNKKDDPEERQRQELRLATFRAKLRPLVTLKTGQYLARMNADQRKELVGLFGQPTAEAIAEAAAAGAVLWTDDLAVADVARQQLDLEKRTWTQAVFIATATPQVCLDLSLFLLHWRYFFTRIEPGIIVPAGNQANWDPETPPLSAVLKWLSAPELQVEGAIKVGGMMLPLIWRHASLLTQRVAVTRMLALEILKRDGGRDIVLGLIAATNVLFKIDIIGGENCKQALQAVLQSRTPGGLLLPPRINQAS